VEGFQVSRQRGGVGIVQTISLLETPSNAAHLAPAISLGDKDKFGVQNDMAIRDISPWNQGENLMLTKRVQLILNQYPPQFPIGTSQGLPYSMRIQQSSGINRIRVRSREDSRFQERGKYFLIFPCLG
jgi:hypothetical protein